MKVIFIKDLKGQGKCKEIKNVSDGYAINYLIKNGYAVKYTDGSKNVLDKQIRYEKEKDSELRSEALALKEILEKEKLVFVVNSNKGKVFGAVSSKQIASKLKEMNYDIDKKNIMLDNMLAMIGYHNVKINLYKEVVANLKVELVSK